MARVDGLDPKATLELAVARRDRAGITGVVLFGSPEGSRVSFAAAIGPDVDTDVGSLLAGPAKLVGGGIGRADRSGSAGGRDATRIDEALAAVRTALGLAS